MNIEYRRDFESFKTWAFSCNWALLEIKGYSDDDGTTLIKYVTPNGILMSITVKDCAVQKVTPWGGS